MRPMFLATALFLGACASAFAQAPAEPASKQSLTNDANCQAASQAQPATPPAPNAADGTAPGNAGTTGWTGGLGGSIVGTNPAGQTENSKTWQPATARGLDLKGAPETPQANC